MHNPLVSIIVPVYNLVPYLPACIASLLGQTYTNTEIIFINDGSTDASLDLLLACEKENRQVKVISQENAGQGAARNNGLDHATGEYVLFVDGDDWIAQETVTICIHEALAADADIICFGYKAVKKQHNELHELFHFEYEPGNFVGQDPIVSFLRESTHTRDSFNTATAGKCYKRSLLEENHIRFRQRIYEDSPFMLEAVFHAKVIRCIKGDFYSYLIRDNQATEQSTTSGKLTENKIASYYQADQAMKDFLISKNIYGKYRADYSRYHNGRVVQYGGYYEIYKKTPITSWSDECALFFKYLKRHRKDLNWQRKGLYRNYKDRVKVLNIGLYISYISERTAHLFFKTYEQKWAKS
ncbi:MAG TPA: glycosyltransferase [Chitinophaga sp.]|uniref:glycosyltransferase family 2 protein n=1 Tax=Chitinophaga sp. TaxID=1869181 RepID=UPI002CCD7491|nr:glycosyltransferase [Chitinophaga sp.]HVI43719.1 glycosyltransferase [Chitinophaga sp.]